MYVLEAGMTNFILCNENMPLGESGANKHTTTTTTTMTEVWGRSVFFPKGIYSVRAPSPNPWGEFFEPTASCPPLSQLSRPISFKTPHFVELRATDDITDVI